MKRNLSAAFVVAVGLALAGCGGSHERAASRKPAATLTDVASVAGAAALAASARSALEQNYLLSVYVLWNNKIPLWAQQSTEGPALASLRLAAGERRARGIRIRMLANRRDVVSFALDPSYSSATAIVVAHERVQPSNRRGHPLGRALELRERGRFILHRAGRRQRFIVWRVVQLR